jgi:peptidoglycan/LPS O-acetylase OafA/YrhL
VRTTDTLTSAIAIVAAIFLLFTGVWAFGWPQSFYDEIATYPPYNAHFLHDFGAFQIGFGLALLLALRMRDALFVALVGTGIGAALHAVAHIIDYGDGGRTSDPYLLGVVAALMLIAAVLRWRTGDSRDA